MIRRSLLAQSITPALAIALAITTGCITVGPDGKRVSKPKKSLSELMPWSKKDEADEPYPTPSKVAATWTPDTLVQTARTPTRGFGGRVFFYDEKSRPVPVNGTLVVHGFDERSETKEGSTKRFEFTPEQLTRHYSQCDLGASYSIWVPWDAVGGEARRISLVASFKTEEGHTVQGVPAIVMLPGIESEASKIATAETKLSPQYIEYRDAQASVSSPSSGLTTTTIKRRSGRDGNGHGPLRMDSSALATMLDTVSATPSADIMMVPKEKTSNVQTTSATMPVSR